MSKLFCVSPGLRVLERQMQQPPGYRPRGYGIPYSEIERVDFDDTDIIIEHGDTPWARMRRMRDIRDICIILLWIY